MFGSLMTVDGWRVEGNGEYEPGLVGGGGKTAGSNEGSGWWGLWSVESWFSVIVACTFHSLSSLRTEVMVDPVAYVGEADGCCVKETRREPGVVIGGDGAEGVEGFRGEKTVGSFGGLGWWGPWMAGRCASSVVTRTSLEGFGGGSKVGSFGGLGWWGSWPAGRCLFFAEIIAWCAMLI